MSIRVVIFDLDGVLYRGEAPLPGALSTLEKLRAGGRRVMYATNNSTRSRADYVARLRHFGFHCELDDVVTSAWATARYLVQHHLRPQSPLIIGGADGLRTELREAGVLQREHAVRPYAETPPDAPVADMVIVGLHQSLTYDDLAEGQRALLAGVPFIAANRDVAFPIEGRLLPGAGGIVAALEVVTGRRAVSIGKPEPFMFQEALQRVGVSGAEALVVGDSLQTDVLAAHRVGALGVLITTGVTSEAAAFSADGVKADHVIGTLDALLELPILRASTSS